MPRKNGKSALASGIALFALLTEGDGAEVYSCAGDREQARIVFGVAKEMIRLDPELAAMVEAKELVLYKNAIEVPGTGSVYRALSSVAELAEGLNPSTTIFDEVHVQPNDELWSAMELAPGTREDPLMVGITTAGVLHDRYGNDSLCHRLYKHGRQVAAGTVEDTSFFFAWWEPEAGVKADHRDPEVWAESNPGFGDLIDPEDFASVLKRSSESKFRAKRTNVFVAGEETWLPFGAWDECASNRPPPPAGEAVVLGFDGSHSRDSTALVGSTIGGDHVWLVRAWERPVGGDGKPLQGWKVPRAKVKEAIRAARRHWDVLELARDPALWEEDMQELEAEGLTVGDFPQTWPRMGPACEDFRAAVLDHLLTHDGDPAFTRHVNNAVGITDPTSRLTRIAKYGGKDSLQTVDIAIAAVIARARAVHHGHQREETSVYEERGPVVL